MPYKQVELLSLFMLTKLTLLIAFVIPIDVTTTPAAVGGTAADISVDIIGILPDVVIGIVIVRITVATSVAILVATAITGIRKNIKYPPLIC